MMNDHAKGLLITFIGGMILTIDIPMIIAGAGDVWSVLLVRSGCSVAVAVTVWLVWRFLMKDIPPLLPGWTGVGIAATYGVSAIFFTCAVFYTSAANLVFILAFNSMFAAGLSWWLIGERPARVTLITMVVLVFAVAIIVSDSLRSGTWIGDLCALLASLFLAVAITMTRKSGKDMGFAPMLGAIIPVLFAIIVLSATGKGIQ
ncbi:MAG: DMT family transporter, partial [Pseudomonadota bacterium]